MSRKFFAAILLIAAGGCRMCSDSCDYSPPVINGPHAGHVGRAGSAVNPSKLTPPTPAGRPAEMPSQPLTPMPGAEF